MHNDDSLTKCIDSLEDEENKCQIPKRQRPAIVSIFSQEPISFEQESIGTQTQTHSNDLACQESTEDLSDDLLSHISERDYDCDQDDGFRKEGQLFETSFDKKSTAANGPDDEFVNGDAVTADVND